MIDPQQIYHRTSLEDAYRIAKSRVIQSSEGVVNFHSNVSAGQNQTRDEISLKFEWYGTYLCTKDPDAPSYNPDELYYVPTSKYINEPTEWRHAIRSSNGSNKNLKLVGYCNLKLDCCPLTKSKIKFLLNELKKYTDIKPWVSAIHANPKNQINTYKIHYPLCIKLMGLVEKRRLSLTSFF